MSSVSCRLSQHLLCSSCSDRSNDEAMTMAQRPPLGRHHYLSVYMAPPDETALAGMRHDHCAALWRREGAQVELVRYWELERVTGLKHHRLPLHDPADARAFLAGLLADEGLGLDDLTGIWGTPWLQTDDRPVALSTGTDLPMHSLSHLFSALLLDWDVFRSGTVVGLALDAAPDWTLDPLRVKAAYAGCVSERGHISLFPVESPGPLWHVARTRFGREEGTLMALGSASTCEAAVSEAVLAELRGLELWNPATSIGAVEAAVDRLIEAVARALAAPDAAVRCSPDARFDDDDNLQSAVMKVIDRVSGDVVERNLGRIVDTYGIDLGHAHLALAGGYALNCPNNTRLLETHRFRGLLAPPCVNDGGQALGLGLMAFHEMGVTASASFRLRHAYHGRDELRLDEALDAFGAHVRSVEDRDLDRVVDDLRAGPVVWVDGAAEIGPRALGHRSILGDPTTLATKDALNRVKQRQWWRPVAPMVLLDEVAAWFETDRPSPFMLEAVRCRPERRHLVPAVLHLDGTARLQTVAREDEPTLHELISRFQARTGVPVLCNTSLNDRGEPIADDAIHALNFCVRKGLTVAYVGGRRVELVEAPPAGVDRPATPATRGPAPFLAAVAARPAAWAALVERGIPPEAVFVASWSPELRSRLETVSRDGSTPQVERFARLFRRVLAEMTVDERRLVDRFMSSRGPDAAPSDITGLDGEAIV
jgi:carbamoyltransferase